MKWSEREFKIGQNTGNTSYISSAIYSTYTPPEQKADVKNANAWRSSPFQNIVFFFFTFLSLCSNLSKLITVLYPHLWWSCCIYGRRRKIQSVQLIDLAIMFVTLITPWCERILKQDSVYILVSNIYSSECICNRFTFHQIHVLTGTRW